MHDKLNLHDGENIHLVQSEHARFAVPFRGVENRVKTKTARPLSALAVQIVFYLSAYYPDTMPYAGPIVKVYYAYYYAL